MNNKIIEEMAFDLIKATSPLGVKDLTEVFNYKKVATDLCNLWNWRKIPEGSVVLSKEEYEKLCHLAYFGYEDVKEQAHKETAKEVLKDVAKTCGDYQWFKNLCKQYGVEVGE